MLDDLNFIYSLDAEKALAVAGEQWRQLEHDFPIVDTRYKVIKNVVLAGMGGSALPGVFLQAWPRLTVPFEIIRNYTLPDYVNEETLVIVSSYSGNTEETLSVLADAQQRSANIAVVTAGGKLSDYADEAGYAKYTIPSGMQPRMSAFYFIAAFVQLLEPLGLINGARKDLSALVPWLHEQLSAWAPEVPQAQNIAKRIAKQLQNKTIIVYSGPMLFPAANKWKISINENAKNLAWSNMYPEYNHNEFIGWTLGPADKKQFAVVELRSVLENERIQKRFVITEQLLVGERPAPIVVQPAGESLLQQLLWASCLGDFVSLYLAILNGVDPTPVALVETFKKELDKNR